MNKIVFSLIPFILAVAFLVFLSGLVISTLWLWFIVPIFKLPILSITQAAGLGLLTSYMTMKVPNATDQGADLRCGATYPIITAIITLTIGWLIK